jgi:hypothetical protein
MYTGGRTWIRPTVAGAPAEAGAGYGRSDADCRPGGQVLECPRLPERAASRAPRCADAARLRVLDLHSTRGGAMTASSRLFTAPVFLGTAFLLFGIAIVEKALNLVGWSLRLLDIEPYQLLDWAVALLMFEIALMLRQMIELWVQDRRSAPVATDPGRPR